MPAKGPAPRKALDVKQRIQAADRELRHLNEVQWIFSKRMLKFGMAAWMFGLSTFFLAVVLMGAQLLAPTYHIWLPLLILGLAAPIVITASLIRKFSLKIRQLERIRRDLLAEYERAILKRVEHIVTGKR